MEFFSTGERRQLARQSVEASFFQALTCYGFKVYGF